MKFYHGLHLKQIKVMNIFLFITVDRGLKRHASIKLDSLNCNSLQDTRSNNTLSEPARRLKTEPQCHEGRKERNLSPTFAVISALPASVFLPWPPKQIMLCSLLSCSSCLICSGKYMEAFVAGSCNSLT